MIHGLTVSRYWLLSLQSSRDDRSYHNYTHPIRLHSHCHDHTANDQEYTCGCHSETHSQNTPDTGNLGKTDRYTCVSYDFVTL